MIINPRSTESVSEDAKVVFLAGPVQGAPNWQDEVANKLNETHPSLAIATPRVPGKLDKNFNYLEQVTWEKRFLKQAARNGCIVFWWCAQDLSLEYEKNRAYAQTTRFEFGRAFGWKDYDPNIKIAVGIDADYKKNGGGSENYIRELCAEHSLHIAKNTDELVEQILKNLKSA